MRRPGQMLMLLAALLFALGGPVIATAGALADAAMTMEMGPDCADCPSADVPTGTVCAEGCALAYAIVPPPAPIAFAPFAGVATAPLILAQGLESPPDPYPPRRQL